MAGKSDEPRGSERLKKAAEKLRTGRHRAEASNSATGPGGRSHVVAGGKSPSKQLIQYPKASSALRQYAVEARKGVAAPTTRLRVEPAARPPAAAKVTPTRARELTPPAPPVRTPASTPIPPVTPAPATPLSAAAHRAIASAADLGSLVRRQRRLREMTQGDLATQAGTGRRFVSDLEGGKPTIEFGRLLAVCAVLGIGLTADGGER